MNNEIELLKIDLFPNQRVLFISDTHFGHENIIKYCNRPFADVDSMDKELIDNWNQTVASDDIVIHNGDFALGKKSIENYVSKLNGQIYIVRGNHDHWSDAKGVQFGFAKIFKKPVEFEIGGKTFFCCHAPEQIVNIGPQADYLLYGHIHDKHWTDEINEDNGQIHISEPKNALCICAEQLDYKPATMERVVDMIEKKNR